MNVITELLADKRKLDRIRRVVAQNWKNNTAINDIRKILSEPTQLPIKEKG